MAITKKEIEHLAFLSRLRPSEKEKEKLQKELSRILDFVEKLKEVETENVGPSVFEKIKNVFREDTIKGQSSKSKVKNLIEQAPEKEGNFIKTKKIF